MEQQLLSIYLNDHLFALTGTHALGVRMKSPNRGTAFEPVIADAIDSLAENVEALKTTMDEVGVRTRPLRERVARVLPKLGLVKLNGRLTTYSPLSRVLEFETLRAAATHDLALWATLERLAQTDQRVPTEVVSEAAARASQLLDALEGAHMEATEVLAQT